MEFVRITYPETRQVRVDLQPQGQTNEILGVEAGLHRFDLGLPLDYAPPHVDCMVAGTSFPDPMEIAFDPVAVTVSMTTVTVSTGPVIEPARAAKRGAKKAKAKKARKARKARKAKKTTTAKRGKKRTAKKRTVKRRSKKRGARTTAKRRSRTR